jgi:hypothetical protein
MQWHKMLDQVGIAVKEVFGVSGMGASFSFPYQQFIFGQQMKESISSNMQILFFKKGLEHY